MSAKPPHLLLVEALFYEHLAADLRRGAERVVAEAGATCEIISVPGTFEVPAAIALAARAGAPYDGYVALGCVIRGETTHYDHICAESARAMQELASRGGRARTAGGGLLGVPAREPCGVGARAGRADLPAAYPLDRAPRPSRP